MFPLFLDIKTHVKKQQSDVSFQSHLITTELPFYEIIITVTMISS